MQPRSSFDHVLLIPIVIGVVSIVGLAWIFLANYRNESPLPPTVEPSVIPFDVTPIGTRRRTPTPVEPPTLEEPLPTATGPSPESYPGPPTETLPSASTLSTESPLPPSATPTQDQGQPLLVGRYDNTDPNIIYDRHWVFRMNAGTKFAYKGTLHTSDSIGNEAFFRFTGERFIFGYQRGRSFGTVTVLIDDQPYSFHQQAFGNIWRSPILPPGTHSVRIIHESGQSINLDYIEVVR